MAKSHNNDHGANERSKGLQTSANFEHENFNIGHCCCGTGNCGVRTVGLLISMLIHMPEACMSGQPDSSLLMYRFSQSDANPALTVSSRR